MVKFPSTGFRVFIILFCHCFLYFHFSLLNSAAAEEESSLLLKTLLEVENQQQSQQKRIPDVPSLEVNRSTVQQTNNHRSQISQFSTEFLVRQIENRFFSNSRNLLYTNSSLSTSSTSSSSTSSTSSSSTTEFINVIDDVDNTDTTDQPSACSIRGLSIDTQTQQKSGEVFVILDVPSFISCQRRCMKLNKRVGSKGCGYFSYNFLNQQCIYSPSSTVIIPEFIVNPWSVAAPIECEGKQPDLLLVLYCCCCCL